MVHFLGIKIDHLVGAVAGNGLNLTVGAASFQKVDGGVLTKAVKRVVFVDTIQTKASPLWLTIFFQSSFAKRLACGTTGETVRPGQFRRNECFAATFSSGKFGL